jgi:hypothetical protein
MTQSNSFVFFGDGPLVQALVRRIDFKSGLLVSDGVSDISDSRLKRISYKDLSGISRLSENTFCLVSTRLDLLSQESQSYFKDFFNGSHEPLFKSMLVFSSCAVYGETKGPASERDFLRALNSYALKKIDLENILLSSAVSERVTCLRIANLYGFQGSNDFISKVLDCSISGENISLPAVDCVRDFVYFGDLAKFINYWLSSNVSYSPEYLNFSTGISTSLRSVIDLVSKLRSTDLKVNNYHDSPDIVESYVSNELLTRYWTQKLVSLEFGLKNLITGRLFD